MSKKKEESILKDKLFWLMLTVIVILPLIGMLTGMFTLELAASGKAIQTISYKTAGSELHFEVKNVEGVKELTVTFLEDVKNAVIESEEVNTISWKFDGVIYSLFKISSSDASKLGEVKLVLRLKETEVNNLGLSAHEVKLYSQGQELETKLTKAEMGYFYYEATSEQIGEFVIGKAKPKVEEVVIEEAEEIPEEEPEAVEEKPIVEQPLPVKESFISKILSFFKNLFN